MDNIFVKPRQIDGQPAIVRDVAAGGKPLDPAGEWKPRTQFWTRRIAQGDVIDATAEQQKKAQPASAQAQPASPASFEPGPKK
jgi:hypothetical protein